MDELVLKLGVEFKASKDEGLDTPTWSIEFLGHWLTTEEGVMAYPAPSKVEKLTNTLAESARLPYMPYKALEELVGKLAFAGQTHRLLKVYLSFIYDVLIAHRPGDYP